MLVKRNNVFVLLIFLVFITSAVGAALPSSTNTNYMWVSDNATNFWIMNSPEEGIENTPSVFHYDSDFNLVEEFKPKKIDYNNKDFARLNKTRWVVFQSNKILIYNQDWKYIRSKKILNKTFEEKPIVIEYNKAFNKIFGDSMQYYAAISEKYNHNRSYSSYEFNPKTLELENRTSVTAVSPQKYPSGRKEWVKFQGAHIINRTRHYGPEDNYTVEEPIYAVDGQIQGGNIWLLEGSRGDDKQGGKVYKFTTDMNYTGRNYSVGLNQSQIRESQGISSMGFTGIYYISIIILFLAAIILVPYSVINSSSEDSD